MSNNNRQNNNRQPPVPPIVPGTPRPGMVSTDQEEATRVAAEIQLETQETAEEQEEAAQRIAMLNAIQDAEDSAEPDREAAIAAAQKAQGKKGEKYVEVLLTRKYAPKQIVNEDGELVDQGEISQTLPAGATVKLPQKEASRALQLGIATATDKTFED